MANPAVEMVAFEKEKIKGAVRTDFILSAEIIVITLGIVATASFGVQVAVLTGIGLIMTVGVYGLVAGIVKLDDAGLYLSQKRGKIQRAVGKYIVLAAPILMKSLSIVGTAAMFLVGGGILTHGLHAIDEWILHLAIKAGSLPGIGAVLKVMIPLLLDALAGIVAGAAVLLVVFLVRKVARPHMVR